VRRGGGGRGRRPRGRRAAGPGGGSRVPGAHPDLLPALKAAGVVDAGGRGLCVLLEALERVVTGECADLPLVAPVEDVLVPRDRTALVAAREDGDDAFGYEVQYLLHGPARRPSSGCGRCSAAWATRSSSSAARPRARTCGTCTCTSTTSGAAVEAGVEAGRPFRITVTRFADQVAEPAPVMNERPVGRGVVAVAPGRGLAALFERVGAVVVDGGPTTNPSTAELLEALRDGARVRGRAAAQRRQRPAVASAAAAAARDEGLSVAVVPDPLGPAGPGGARASPTPSRSFADDVAAMAEAAGSTRWAEVTTAVREAATWAGICRPGDVLGLLEGDVVLIGSDDEASPATCSSACSAAAASS
jgi:dihydroxyacetone kinase-like predicted kinase